MTRFTKLPTQALAIGLFAITGLAAANPMAHLVDCNDSFWEVACSTGDAGETTDTTDDAGETTDTTDVIVGETTDTTDVIVGELITIDSDPVCAVIDGGFIVCHT